MQVNSGAVPGEDGMDSAMIHGGWRGFCILAQYSVLCCSSARRVFVELFFVNLPARVKPRIDQHFRGRAGAMRLSAHALRKMA